MHVIYVGPDEHKDVEDICFADEHIAQVEEAIKANFDEVFNSFLETENNIVTSPKTMQLLKEKFGTGAVKQSTKNLANVFKNILIAAIDDFEKDRHKYVKIMNLKFLGEYEDNPAAFKDKVLRNDCPIIHSTLQNKKAKELDKYRINFKKATGRELLDVVTNITKFCEEYVNDFQGDEYDEIDNIDDLAMARMDEDECTVYAVIGGGIKSHLAYKVCPSFFSNRSRNAIWALWYLTGKKNFGCKMDSEFIMIETSQDTFQQNYFYPYELFNYYAFAIYKLLKEKAENLGVYIDPNYRYVAVDAFLGFIADSHDDEISFYKTRIRDEGRGYA